MNPTIHRPEAFQNQPSGVLFDTDNTLYPYAPAHGAAISEVRLKAARLFGIEATQFDEVFNVARQATKQRLGHTASSHSRLLYFQTMLENLGLGSQVLRALDLEQTYWRAFLSRARLFDGVREFLDDLRLSSIPTAVVTDLTAQVQFRKLVYFGLDHYFDYIVTSEEAGFDKPHAAAFQIAVAKMKPLNDCIWMIGDDPSNDIIGARDAIGAVTIQKVHQGVTVGQGDAQPDAVIQTFQSLRQLFANTKSVTSRALPG